MPENEKTDDPSQKQEGFAGGLSLKPVVTWQEQDEILRALWQEGKTPEEIAEKLDRSVAAIMTRAARLSLPRRSAPGRKRGYKRTDAPRRVRKTPAAPRVKISRPSAVKEEEECVPVVSDAGTRVCLMCLNKFQSQGRHNRICPACKGSAEYVTGSSTVDFSFQIGK